MIRYLAHTVYVVTATYPGITTCCAVVRPAAASDVQDAGTLLGVISEGRCIPLSPAEARILGRKS